MAAGEVIPPPPAGFSMQDVPPPPAGFNLEGAAPLTPKEKGVKMLAEDRTGAQLAEVPRAMIQNTGAKILSGYTGLAGALLPGPQGQGANWAQKTENALSYEPKNPNSQIGLKAAGLPFEYLVEKPSHALGQKIGEKSPLAGALIEGGLQAAPLALGLRGGKSSITPKQQGAANAAEHGFKATPSDAGAGAIPRILEGLSGEPKLAKNISDKNAARGAEMVAEDIGIPHGTPLSREAIQNVRRQSHRAYEEARGLGEIKTTPAYDAALDAIEAPHTNAARSFPNAKPGPSQEIRELVAGLRVKSFDSSGGVDMVNALREAANKAYASGDGGVGKATKAAAQAVEDAIVDHAVAVGAPVAPQLALARRHIAKTYEADKALGTEGSINPQAYVRLADKGKPLSGAGEAIAESAKQNPRSFQKPTGGNSTTPQFMDYAMAILGGTGAAVAHGAVSGGVALPLLVARPGVRAGLSSDLYQRIQNQPQPVAGPALMKALQAGTLSVPPPQRNQ